MSCKRESLSESLEGGMWKLSRAASGGVYSFMNVPGTLGVMVLPGAVLFPGALLPLYIFEPRYRTMLAGALEDGRVFAGGQPRSADGSEVAEIGGAGLVRACVAKPDGTSHLILQGVARVRFTEWLSGEDFPQASVEMLESRIEDLSAAKIQRDEVCHLCHQLGGGDAASRKSMEGCLDKSGDLAEFSDLVGATVVADVGIRQKLISELNVNRRLDLLTTYLRRLVVDFEG